MAWSWDKSMSFPTFKFDFDQLGTWEFWKRWIVEFIGCTLFAVTVGALGGNAWAWGFSYLVWTSVMGCTVLSSVTFSESMSNENFIQGAMHLLAQGLACNLAACPDFQKFFGVSGFAGSDALEFKGLFGGAAIFEFVTVFVYFFFLTKGCDGGLPGWLFTSMLVAGAFWLNAGAIFTPSRIWTAQNSWSGVFGTYLNNFLGVYFGVNVSNYLFAGKMEQMM